MHKDGVTVRYLHDVVVNTKPGEVALTLFLFFFHAHAGPDVSDDHVGITAGFGGVVQHTDTATGFVEQFSVGFVASGAGHAKLKIKQHGQIDVGVAHVVAVANPANRLSLDVTSVIKPGLHVCEHLAGVKVIGQTVNHRHGRRGGKALQALM